MLLWFMNYGTALEDLEKKLQSRWRRISVTYWHFCKTVVPSFVVTKNAKCYLLKECKFGPCLGPAVLAHFSLYLPVVNSILLVITTKESKKSSSSEEQELRDPAAIAPKKNCAWAAFPIVLACL